MFKKKPPLPTIPLNSQEPEFLTHATNCGFISLGEPFAVQKTKKPRLFGIVASLTALTCLVCAGVFAYQRLFPSKPVIPMVYFEIKVINERGNPIAAAEISHDAALLGVTDSFGEWRKYIPARPGSSLTFKITKRPADDSRSQITALKNIVVPLRKSKDGEIHVVHSVELVVNPPTLAPTPPQPRPEIAPPPAAPAAFAFNSMHLQVLSPRLKGLSQKLTQRLDDEKIRRSELSPWQVIIDTLNPAEGSPMLRVRSIFPTASGKKEISFLRPYTEALEALSDGVLITLREHTPYAYVTKRGPQGWIVEQPAHRFWQLQPEDVLLKDKELLRLRADQKSSKVLQLNGKASPCAPGETQCLVTRRTIPQAAPDFNWAPFKLRIPSLKKGASVYVSGYQANPVGKDLYEFWGQPLAKPYVTIVDGAKILSRRQIINDGKNSLYTLRSLASR